MGHEEPAQQRLEVSEMGPAVGGACCPFGIFRKPHALWGTTSRDALVTWLEYWRNLKGAMHRVGAGMGRNAACPTKTSK